MRRRARRGFAHSWRVGGLDIPGMANWKYCFPPTSTEQGYLKTDVNLLGLLKTIYHWKRADSKSTIFINLLQFFHILPPKNHPKVSVFASCNFQNATWHPIVPTSKMVSGVSVFATSRPGAISIANWKRHLRRPPNEFWGYRLSHEKMPTGTAGMYAPRCDILRTHGSSCLVVF